MMVFSTSQGANATSGLGLPHYRRFMVTLRHTTHSRIPLGKWSTQRRDFYLTRHNTYKWHTSILPEGIQTHNSSKQVATNPSLRLCGYRYTGV